MYTIWCMHKQNSLGLDVKSGDKTSFCQKGTHCVKIPEMKEILKKTKKNPIKMH